MMTGQILSGVEPLTAARYQIMVMCMIFSTAGLAAVIYMFIKKNTSTNSEEKIKKLLGEQQKESCKD